MLSKLKDKLNKPDEGQPVAKEKKQVRFNKDTGRFEEVKVGEETKEQKQKHE